MLREASPHARAIIVPGPRDSSGRRGYFQLTFLELDRLIDRYARGLTALGVREGTRALVMVRPSFELFGLVFALFRMGAIPVLLDPGMERKNVLSAIGEVEPEALIAIPRAHVARVLFKRAFRSVRIKVTVGKRAHLGGTTLAFVEALGGESDQPFCGPVTRSADPAAILFTSGSTGPPKGVVYTHGIFDEQVRIFKDELGIEPGEIDLSAFPLFSLFSLAIGVTCAVPDMDATHPARVDPRLIVEQIRDLGVTYAFGSPAFWLRIAEHAGAHRVRLETIRRIFMAGAPAPISLLEALSRIIPPNADVFTPYGATECLPVTMPSARMILAGPAAETRQGAGTCVGAPLGRTEVRIIRITDEPIAELRREDLLPAGQIGEILVQGPVTTRSYFRRPKDDQTAKIKDGARVWHRMGDAGYLDACGRLWFCGRKSHRVETGAGTMYTESCEAIFNRHARVRRSALVGLGPRGGQRPVIIIECIRGVAPKNRREREALKAELLGLGETSELTRPIRDLLFHPALPVDPRHNAKIIREALAVWAVKQLGAPAHDESGGEATTGDGTRRAR